MVGGAEQPGELRQDLVFGRLVQPFAAPDLADISCGLRLSPGGDECSREDHRAGGRFRCSVAESGKDRSRVGVFVVERTLRIGAKLGKSWPALEFLRRAGDLVGRHALDAGHGDCPRQDMPVKRTLAHPVADRDCLLRILVGKRVQSGLQVAAHGRNGCAARNGAGHDRFRHGGLRHEADRLYVGYRDVRVWKRRRDAAPRGGRKAEGGEDQDSSFHPETRKENTP